LCECPHYVSPDSLFTRYPGRYVDHQLKTSRLFDAAGMEKDHLELFIPVPKRWSSSGFSLASVFRLPKGSSPMAEGQLRYWTSEMCNRTSHPFDFVVTVCVHPFPYLFCGPTSL
jgi:hypothetical protein